LGSTWQGARAEDAWPSMRGEVTDHLGDAGGREQG
jgi:hypothetical protein